MSTKAIILAIPAIALGFATPATTAAPDHISVSSPNGRISLKLDLADGRPQWSVTRDDAPILRPGALGMIIDGKTSAPVEALD